MSWRYTGKNNTETVKAALIVTVLILIAVIFLAGCAAENENGVRITPAGMPADTKTHDAFPGESASACTETPLSNTATPQPTPVVTDTPVPVFYTVRYRCFPEEAGYYEGGAVKIAYEGECVEAVEVHESSGYRFTGWSDGEENIMHSSFVPSEDTEITALFEVIPTIPEIYITTADGKSVSSKTEYKDAALTARTLIKELCIEDMACSIRGHGNSTWDNFKKTKPSYRLKLSEKTSLLGVGDVPGKDYVLISNMADATMLRNWTALRLARNFTAIDYVISERFVHLYINGDYRGVYQLCEKIETGKSRMNLNDGGEETDIDYLLELDVRAEEEKDKVFFKVSGMSDYPIVIKSDGKNDAQKAYIKDVFTEFYKACKSGDREKVDALADIPSIIDMFILEEFTRERDAGFASFYMVKYAGGKIYFTCPWDYDLSLGNDNMFRATKKLVTDSDRPNPWFKLLYKTDWFRKEAAARFKELRPVIERVMNETWEMAEFMREANARNDEKWHVYGRRLLWEPSNLIENYKNYDEHLKYYKNWTDQRLEWLTDLFKQYE